ncbi:hypothetical protein Tco_1121849 [Tanacetum coccineum]|uniref:Uncharacterized protein n=1 Tax=Tanacetum coccineum TaxID=301880 RepID=A0ABQ5IZ30_9ASTR
MGKRRKQIARKGLHTAKDEAEKDEASEEDDSSSGINVPINHVPVAVKSPSIASYKIIKQGKKGVYQIVRENGTDKVYMSLGAMLKEISREDLTELYRIVMKRYGTEGPTNDYERVFWENLKTMFDAPLSTDLFGLYQDSADIYMLAERKYPLSANVCQTMLKMKLLDGKMNEDCYKLLKMVEKQDVDLDLFKLAIVLQKANQIQDFGPTHDNSCLSEIYPIIVPSDSNVEDAFSSTTTPDYTLTSPDYFPASPRNTSPDPLDDLSKYLLASLAISPFHDDPYMKVMQAYNATSNELPIPLPQTPIASPTVLPPSLVLPLSPMFDPQDFFLPEEILPPHKRARFLSSSSNFSAPPQVFEIGESSHKMHLE